MNRDKKREWATYRSLHLHRRHKSKAKRAADQQAGLFVYVGGSQDRPFMKVPRPDYLRALEEEIQQLNPQQVGSGMSRDAFLDLMRPTLENRIYDRFLEQDQTVKKMEEAIFQQEGRMPTTYEKSLFAKTLTPSSTPWSPRDRANKIRRHWVHSLLRSIRCRTDTHPDHLQQIWQNLVGPEDAGQVRLTHVNRQRGLAYCQSLNPSVSYRLQRQPQLRVQLGEALKVRIRKIVFR